MNPLKRALVNASRNLGKTIALLAIVLVLGSVVSGAISVRQAIQNTDKNLRLSMPTVVTVEPDFRAIEEYVELHGGQWPDVEWHLPPELFIEIGNLPQVRNYDFFAETGLLSDSLKKYIEGGDIFGLHDDGMGDWLSFHLKGVHSTELLDIEEGLIEIDSGRMFTADELSSLSYVALVSYEFANANNLQIGSTFTLENIGWNTRGLYSWDPSFYIEENIYRRQSYTFEVVGIFISNAEVHTGDRFTDQSVLTGIKNRIYVPNTVAIAAQTFLIEHEKEMHPGDVASQQETLEDLLNFQSVYALNDPLGIEEFRAIVEEMTPDFWTVIDLSDSYGDIASAMQTLNDIATASLWFAIVSSIVILSLLITLSLRERKREIGVYLALGERKSTVIVQMLVETVTVAICAIILALFVGNIVADNISESMLRADLAVSQGLGEGQSPSALSFMGFGGPAIDEALASYNVALDATTIVLFFAVAIGAVLVATILPMLYIVRLNPKKIML